jgi:hypothetical protein
MSNEDWRERAERIERTIEFIVEHQAQAEVRASKADERWAGTENGIRALLAIAEIPEREIGEIREASVETTKSLNELRDAGRATDERLNVLISVVEKQINERRNGKSQDQDQGS